MVGWLVGCRLVGWLVAGWLVGWKTLASVAASHWDAIATQTLDFERKAEIASALRALAPPDLRSLFAATVADGGADRRPLLVLVDKGSAPARSGDVVDGDAFAAGLPLASDPGGLKN